MPYCHYYIVIFKNYNLLVIFYINSVGYYNFTQVFALKKLYRISSFAKKNKHLHLTNILKNNFVVNLVVIF